MWPKLPNKLLFFCFWGSMSTVLPFTNTTRLRIWKWNYIKDSSYSIPEVVQYCILTACNFSLFWLSPLASASVSLTSNPDTTSVTDSNSAHVNLTLDIIVAKMFWPISHDTQHLINVFPLFSVDWIWKIVISRLVSTIHKMLCHPSTLVRLPALLID